MSLIVFFFLKSVKMCITYLIGSVKWRSKAD